MPNLDGPYEWDEERGTRGEPPLPGELLTCEDVHPGEGCRRILDLPGNWHKPGGDAGALRHPGMGCKVAPPLHDARARRWRGGLQEPLAGILEDCRIDTFVEADLVVLVGAYPRGSCKDRHSDPEGEIIQP